MFLPRLLSGAVLLAGILALIVAGGPALWFMSLLVALLAARELLAAAGEDTNRLSLAVYPLILAYYILIRTHRPAIGLVLAAVLAWLVVFVLRFPTLKLGRPGVYILALCYTGIMSSCLYLIRRMEGGMYLCWLVLCSSWGCDTLAYCAGRLFGKRHPFPELSPKKTMAGCVGGVAGSMALCLAVAVIMKQDLLFAVLAGGAGAVLSVFGDLAASAIKRQYGVKDYGKLIPGHGGVLDRFDSMLFTGSAVYLCAVLMACLAGH